ncbi:hypothetical protein [Flagellimonas sp. CMM7]|uniref:hypothetical protein n=1 Tax=Flagellimonas sp. CMM7 TaxID=2654676 RepID=UPI0013D28028|nr:hypothetical protein [Flagellimonas sp. CMM7]UII80013.1 hypothetical protein LV704_00480 [Flagellimonas sp. CMM7]
MEEKFENRICRLRTDLAVEQVYHESRLEILERRSEKLTEIYQDKRKKLDKLTKRKLRIRDFLVCYGHLEDAQLVEKAIKERLYNTGDADEVLTLLHSFDNEFNFGLTELREFNSKFD